MVIFPVIPIIGLAAPADGIQHPLPDVRIIALLYVVIQLIHHAARHGMDMRVGDGGHASPQLDHPTVLSGGTLTGELYANLKVNS